MYKVLFTGNSIGCPRLTLADTSADIEWMNRIASQAAIHLAGSGYHWYGIFDETDKLVKECTFRQEVVFT